MVDTVEFIADRFDLDLTQKPPVKIDQVNRTIMSQVLNELNFKVGAEIGVAQGHHAKMLCENNPGLKLYAVDVWDTYDGYREYTNRIHKYYEEAKERLAPFDVEFVRKFSMDALEDFEDNSLDFVYIDGAHDFKNVSMDICEWSKKVRPGGIVFGHDYKRYHPGRSKYIVHVKDVVQAFMYSHHISPWFVMTNKIKDPKFGRDNPAWMYVRGSEDHLV